MNCKDILKRVVCHIIRRVLDFEIDAERRIWRK